MSTCQIVPIQFIWPVSLLDCKMGWLQAGS